jgi:hypothetical protein
VLYHPGRREGKGRGKGEGLVEKLLLEREREQDA